MTSTGTPRHFLSIDDFDYSELRGMLTAAGALKARLKQGDRPQLLKDKVLAMIFERQSTRTRVSFDVGMRQLGGETIILTGQEMQLSREETLSDTAKVLSRYVDAIMIRILSHADLLELSEAATVPVINGLTRRAHPCQIMADLMTFEEHRGNIRGAKVAWVGDSNNVLHSWVNAAELFECQLTIATPEEYSPEKDLMDDIRRAGDKVRLIQDPREAVEGADLVITDTWVSMGDVDVAERRRVLKPYQVNPNLMALADKNALFMHDLPAHR
ncbi:MAG: ornithine carbamoyltransferase, partial [Devosia sp.]